MNGLAGEYVLNDLQAAPSFMVPDFEVIACTSEEVVLQELKRGHGTL